MSTHKVLKLWLGHYLALDALDIEYIMYAAKGHLFSGTQSVYRQLAKKCWAIERLDYSVAQ